MAKTPHVPCPAQHTSGRSCAKRRGHDGLHHVSGPGFSLQWGESVTTTPGGGRIRITAAEISIERTGRR